MSTTLQQVTSITCDNDAGFDMHFQVGWSGGTTNPTGNYPIDQARTIPLDNLGIPANAQVWPIVHAVLGKTKTGPPVLYVPGSANAATYQVKGTTLDYSVNLLG